MDNHVIIGIDARFAIHQRRGIGNYVYHLLRYLAKLDQTNQYILYTDREDSEGVLPNQDNFQVKQLRPSNYFLWEQIALPEQARRDRVNILHCTGNTAPRWIPRKTKLIVTIHDVMYLSRNNNAEVSRSFYQRLGRLYRRIVVPSIVNTISKVITVSNFSKQDILNALPQIPEEHITVIHEAANEIFERIPSEKVRNTLSDLGLVDDYILTLGGLDPRKNTELVIKAFLDLRKKQQISSKLVVVGIPNWHDTSFNKIVLESSYHSDVIFTEFLSEEDLVALYNGCKVFLYPSLYEGFGMPPLEAMSCGVPVITSQVTSIPEIVGDAARLIDPMSIEQLKNEIMAINSDEDLRQALVQRGLEQIKKFSWERMALDTFTLYQNLAGKA